jgi:hypothetical protein
MKNLNKSIPELIQETEKGCGIRYYQDIKNMDNDKFCGKILIDECNVEEQTPLCPICQAKLQTLKQCQTIAEEKTKDFINVLQWIYTNIGTEDDEDASVMIRIDKYINTLKQQLNPAQTKE